MGTRKYDSTVARIAGNIIGHLITRQEADPGGGTSYGWEPSEQDVKQAVRAARAIVAEVIATEPEVDPA